MNTGPFLLALIAIFVSAKLFGEIAERLHQPAVLGELIGGAIIGVSGLRLVDPSDPTMGLFAQLGVIFLLFLIGLETDLNKLLSVGGSATIVAVVGVGLPFVGGYYVASMLHMPTLVCVVIGASLTATSVGITARVLSDLGHLDDAESQVILGAAVIDDIIGLIILTMVSTLTRGGELTAMGIARTVVIAFGFVILAVVIGSLLAPAIIRLISRIQLARGLLFTAVVFAFTLAWAAERVGSAMIIGAFAAGLVLARCGRGEEIEREVHDVAQFFIPVFFVIVGASVDVRSLTGRYLLIGLALTAVGILGKLIAGFAALRPGLRRIVVGVGMIPRGEVGLIFAQVGLLTGLLSAGLYASVTLMVILTTFVTPLLLRMLLEPRAAVEVHGHAELVTNPPMEDGTP